MVVLFSVSIITMKYIVTGGSGFIGSHLVKKLIHLGRSVVVVDDHSTGPLDNIMDSLTEPGLTLIENDILSMRNWDGLLEPNDVIIHLAATVGVNRVYVNPLETLNNNFQPTVFLLKKAAKHKCKLFFSSTSEVYGELNGDSSRETDPMVLPGTHCGRGAYVLGKIMSEQYCLNYARQFKVPVIVGRFFNVTGTNQIGKYGMVVPTFVEQALCNEPITIFGDGKQTRSFCDVMDIVDGINGLIEEEAAYGEVFNIGGTERITINDLATHIKHTLESKSEITHVYFPEQRANGRDVLHRCANIDKIKSLIGWEPRSRWIEIINKIIFDRSHQYGL